jgi:hypothetical protein
MAVLTTTLLLWRLGCFWNYAGQSGLGNQKSWIDQSEGQLYHETSEKAANGIKHLGILSEWDDGCIFALFLDMILRSYKRVLCSLRRHCANKVHSSAAIAAHSCGTRGNLNCRFLVVNFVLFSEIKINSKIKTYTKHWHLYKVLISSEFRVNYSTSNLQMFSSSPRNSIGVVLNHA